MARNRPSLNTIFQATEPPVENTESERAAPSQPASSSSEKDRIVPVGVGLRLSELAQVEAIAAEHGLKRNAILRKAVLVFLEEYRAGRVKLTIDVETKPRLRY